MEREDRVDHWRRRFQQDGDKRAAAQRAGSAGPATRSSESIAKEVRYLQGALVELTKEVAELGGGAADGVAQAKEAIEAVREQLAALREEARTLSARQRVWTQGSVPGAFATGGPDAASWSCVGSCCPTPEEWDAMSPSERQRIYQTGVLCEGQEPPRKASRFFAVDTASSILTVLLLAFWVPEVIRIWTMYAAKLRADFS